MEVKVEVEGCVEVKVKVKYTFSIAFGPIKCS